jgi:hypothetical protein
VYEFPDPNLIHSDELAELGWRALHEFDDVADYIWKSPRLIDHEDKLERRKLEIHFPGRPDMAKLRWDHESRKLTSVFPYLIAVGNLYTVLSLFENYLLLLHQLAKKQIVVAEDLIRGQGATRCFNYFKESGIAIASINLYEQVQAAMRIRNCMVHAAGILSSSRETTELRRIQSKKIYLDPELRKKPIEDEEVSIYKTTLGERLQITNSYSHLLCSYSRDFFINLCKAIDEKLTY